MTPTPVERLLEKLPDAKRNGKGWSCRCPAHDDRRASLSIGEGDDGRVLVRCHAGCSVDAVCKAVGLRPADLFLPSTFPTPKGEDRRHHIGKPTAKTFATAADAVAELERQHGPRSAHWTYRDASGEPVGVIVRWNLSDGGKDIRPVSRHGDKWIIGGMPEPRPLYALPDLADAGQVCVTEGEKAADAARSIGLIGTTSAHGSQSADKTDWTPLAGKRVVILPDNDETGEKYANAVISALAKLTPMPLVKVVNLPGLSEHDDIVEWIEAGGTAEKLIELTNAAPEWKQSAQPWPEIVSFDVLDLPNFPTDALPDVLQKWVEAESHATQTPADLAGLLSLAVCSACLARRVVVEPRNGWCEPVNLFVVVLLEPGNRKSAVFADATKPLRELEAELIEAARPVVAREQCDRRQDEARLRKLERMAAEKGDAEARREAGDLAATLAKQPEPALPRLIVDDATSEKLGMMLDEQDGRIASMSPEGGVFDLMAGLYSKSGSPQFDVYLKGHSGDELITDRVSRKSVRVEWPALTCAYATQPTVIGGLAKNPVFRGRGLLGRFLYAAPRSWIGRREIAAAPVSDATREAYRQAVRGLDDHFAKYGSAGEPFVLRLSGDGLASLGEWEAEIEAMLGDGGQMEIMRDWGAKLAGATLRLAAVLHCVQRGEVDRIEGQTVAAAVAIARYLIPNAEAVLNLMLAKEGSTDEDAHYLLRWIGRHERREFTKSEAQHHGKRRFPKADDIDPALNELTRRGFIRPKLKEATGPGRPSSPTYEVHPAVFVAPQPGMCSQNSCKSARERESGNCGNIGSALEQSETENRVQVTI